MNSYDFTGKVIVVTGSDQGIGKSIAQRFYECGGTVVTNSRSEEGLKRLERNPIGADSERIFSGVADVSKPEQVYRLFQEVVDRFCGFDILVNNAGIWDRGDVLSVDERQWDKVLDTDLKSVFFASQWFCRYHIEAGTPGAIVNISSINAARSRPGCAVYNIAKAGVKSATETFALEVGKYGIRVNAVGPGSIPTALNESFYKKAGAEEAYNATVPLGRRGRKEEVANTVLFLASDDASYLTGQTIYVEGGWLLH
ncbi:hypothetical protein JI75_06895 [Berryella intestinalis]|uniref:3beta-hydroxycholanate 3-dehydrogenase (NAD(+)) n=1 Tax=Berryella intestinalis TaxID=1531429 RepID=A0A0A8BB67_9ACTN|nr:SDR family NAD(P)-dependent oxidoreductase [Berryella intestinalis]AJC12427.1 hypothetical protein JI75_06895 [Berryella intestinalis]